MKSDELREVPGWARKIAGEMYPQVSKDKYTQWEVEKLLMVIIPEAIQQERNRVIEAEFKVLNDFMGFMRNGHNLKPGDLDRIEGEFALFIARNYSDLYLNALSNKEGEK